MLLTKNYNSPTRPLVRIVRSHLLENTWGHVFLFVLFQPVALREMICVISWGKLRAGEHLLLWQRAGNGSRSTTDGSCFTSPGVNTMSRVPLLIIIGLELVCDQVSDLGMTFYYGII